MTPPTPCDFPTCHHPAVRRTDGTNTCPTHEHVHVSSTGSWLDTEPTTTPA